MSSSHHSVSWVIESRHFTPDEFRCQCGCGDALMDYNFVSRLENLRRLYNKPIILTSAKRCPEYNARISTTGRNGPHTTGKAVDIRVSGQDAWTLLGCAFRLGFRGIGVAQKGPHNGRFVHLDMLEHKGRPWVWTY